MKGSKVGEDVVLKIKSGVKRLPVVVTFPWEISSSSVDNSVNQIGSIVSSNYEHSTEERDFETLPSALNGKLDEIENDHGDALPFNKFPSELESSKHVNEELVDLKEPSVEEVNDEATDFTSKDVKPPHLAGPNVMNIILVAAECAPW
ncbi:hypothetical protein EV2_044178 [Malus domestica]